MLGAPKRQPLLISSILRFAARHHPHSEVVSRLADGRRHRTTYAALDDRSRRLLAALPGLGVLPGDRVATLAWNGFRHLEVAYAVTGLGAVFHPLDPSLPEDDLASLIEQGDASVLFVDADFAELTASLLPHVHHWVRRVVVLCSPHDMPPISLPGSITLHCHESLLDDVAQAAGWPEFDEKVAGVLCATRGAAGGPRAVLHTHRDIVLQAMSANQPDGLGLRATDRVLLGADMAQACAWGLPFAAPMVGAALLLQGWDRDGANMAGLIAIERASCAIGPPAMMQALQRHLARSETDMPGTLRRVVIAGAAAPATLVAGLAARGVTVRQCWGLSEAGALLTTTEPTAATSLLRGAARARLAQSQGRALFGTELRLVDADGAELPWDGLALGEVQVRGATTSSNAPTGSDAAEAKADAGGWLPTGDVASIDAHGYLSLQDRMTDMIRSAGQRISARTLENAALQHPDVAEAACVAASHPKWHERPLLLVVPHAGRTLNPADVLERMRQVLPRWWVPDAIVQLAALPRSGRGRVDKLALRRQYAGHLTTRLPTRY